MPIEDSDANNPLVFLDHSHIEQKAALGGSHMRQEGVMALDTHQEEKRL